MHTHPIFSGDAGHERGVVRHEIGLGGEAEVESALAGEHFQHLAGDLEAALSRLVGIGGGADPDGIARFQAPNFGPKRKCVKLFRVNLALEKLRIAQFHEFMRVARIAIFTAIFTAAIGIYGPDGPHPSRAASDEPARFKFQILDLALGFEQVAGSGQARNTDKLGGGIVIEKHGGGTIFAFYSPKVKVTTRLSHPLVVALSVRDPGILAVESHTYARYRSSP